MNYFDGPEQKFFKTFDAMKASADANWLRLWGCTRCGPFNTDCLAAPGQHVKPTGHSCTQVPQPLPALP